ncbi:MAG: hypothetical protein HY722_04505 [Planctomycetes bacterium]|nr:hypothetical protein [Planctomycetota bacterium]
MKQFAAFTLVVFALVGGVLHGKSRHDAARPRPATVPPAETDGGPSTAGEPAAPRSAPNAQRTDPAQVARLLEQGEARLRAGDFDGARALLERARDLAADARLVDLTAGAARQASRAVVLHALTQHIQPDAFSDGKDLVELELADGRDLVARGRTAEGGRGAFQGQLQDGTEISLEPAEIASSRALSGEAWRERCRRRVDRGAQAAGTADSADARAIGRWQIACYALQCGLADRAAPLLGEALGDASDFLIETFCFGDIAGLKRHWEVARGVEAPREVASRPGDSTAPDPTPASTAAAVATGPVEVGPPATTDAGDAEPARPVSDPRPASGALGDPDYTRFQARFGEANRHYLRSFGETPQARDELATAFGLFREAQEILDRLSTRHPDDPDVERAYERLQVLLYDCQKRKAL